MDYVKFFNIKDDLNIRIRLYNILRMVGKNSFRRVR